MTNLTRSPRVLLLTNPSSLLVSVLGFLSHTDLTYSLSFLRSPLPLISLSRFLVNVSVSLVILLSLLFLGPTDYVLKPKIHLTSYQHPKTHPFTMLGSILNVRSKTDDTTLHLRASTKTFNNGVGPFSIPTELGPTIVTSITLH